MLRDNPDDPQARKDAEKILEMALGRPSTRARFLPQRTSEPTSPDGQTSSGRLVGKIQTDAEGRPFFKPHIELISYDYLRVGYEDENWHSTLPVTRRTPKAGTFTLRLPRHKTPKAGTPVFLIDRREPELVQLIAEWKRKLDRCKGSEPTAVEFTPKMPKPAHPRRRPDMTLRASLPYGSETRRSRNSVIGLWLSPKSVREVSRTVAPNMAWWLPPVIWPDEEELWKRIINEAIRNGAKHFVCNEPWQAAFFKGREVDLVAGPFCNAANAFTLASFAKLGFSAAFVSPELTKEDFLALPKTSPLPLGIVLAGFWPMGIGRHDPLGIEPNEVFQSPKGEGFWTRRYGQNTWIYPAWPLDITVHRPELEAAGYSFFARMEENPPKSMPAATRPGLFNWEGDLL